MLVAIPFVVFQVLTGMIVTITMIVFFWLLPLFIVIA